MLSLYCFLQFVHDVSDDWCGRKSPRYQDYGKVWPITEWKDAVAAGRHMVMVAVGKAKERADVSAVGCCDIDKLHSLPVASLCLCSFQSVCVSTGHSVLTSKDSALMTALVFPFPFSRA